MRCPTYSLTLPAFTCWGLSPLRWRRVTEVTKEPPQHGRRKQRLCHEGRCFWAGGSAALIHFVSFSSAGNERWIRKTPLGLKKNGCSRQTLMVTEKCARQHSGNPDISQGQVPAPSFHYICPGTRLETSCHKMPSLLKKCGWQKLCQHIVYIL